MNDAPAYAVSLTIGIAFLVSLATLFRLFQKHIDGRPLLEFEPRRPAPWNFLAPLVMLAPLLLALSSALRMPSEADSETNLTGAVNAAAAAAAAAPPTAAFSAASLSTVAAGLPDRVATAQSLASRLWLQSLMTVAMALAAYLLLAVAFGATPQDLGLPRDGRQLLQDVKIGATAWAAAMAPIYFILYVLTALFEPESGHPLIQELLADHSLSMMAAAAFAAVVAAPLYEETAFRLIFQGWLERREMLSQPVVVTEISSPAPEPYLSRKGDAPAEPSSVYQGPVRQTSASSVEPGPRPPATVESASASQVTYTGALPGWTPILISGTLFGLAHYGHGVSPVPLILLGFIMGYLYQRTHRVTPGMVCHLLFNAFTFVILALQFASATE
jgi:membrane protease YdiL (CAAX protease family)